MLLQVFCCALALEFGLCFKILWKCSFFTLAPEGVFCCYFLAQEWSFSGELVPNWRTDELIMQEQLFVRSWGSEGNYTSVIKLTMPFFFGSFYHSCSLIVGYVHHRLCSEQKISNVLFMWITSLNNISVWTCTTIAWQLIDYTLLLPILTSCDLVPCSKLIRQSTNNMTPS